MSNSFFQLPVDLLDDYGRRYSYPRVLGRLSAGNLTSSSLPGSVPMLSAAGYFLQSGTILTPLGLQTKPGIKHNRWTEKRGLSNEISGPRGSWCLGTGLFACAVKRLILSRAGILGSVWGCKDREGLAPWQ